MAGVDKLRLYNGALKFKRETGMYPDIVLIHPSDTKPLFGDQNSGGRVNRLRVVASPLVPPGKMLFCCSMLAFLDSGPDGRLQAKA